MFDPISERFAVGAAPSSYKIGASPHVKLAHSIGADTKTVVGGMLSHGPNGEVFTNEFSGHFWQNWTTEVREQVDAFLTRKTGLLENHTEGL